MIRKDNDLKILLDKGLISSYIELERFWNDGSPSGFTFKNNVGYLYSPFSKIDKFSLPIFLSNKINFTQIGTIPPGWRERLEHDDNLPFPIHPEITDDLKNVKQFDKNSKSFYIDVVPTASSRTVLWTSEDQKKRHFLKLHYPKMIGRFKRDLYLYKWLSSLENSREILSFKCFFPPKFSFLRENAGTFVEGSNGKPGFGIIYREFTPYPPKHSSLLIPSFSLFSKNNLQERQQPLLVQLLINMAKPMEYFLENFVEPVLDSYIFLSCETGLIPENNAQNALFEINIENMETRYVLRDMADIFKDLSLREEKGLHTSLCSYHTIDISTDEDYFRRRSFAYDFKCSKYLIKPMIDCFVMGLNIPAQKVYAKVQEMAKAKWKRYKNYFEKENEWFAYPMQSNVGRESYIRRANPDFR